MSLLSPYQVLVFLCILLKHHGFLAHTSPSSMYIQKFFTVNTIPTFCILQIDDVNMHSFQKLVFIKT